MQQQPTTPSITMMNHQIIATTTTTTTATTSQPSMNYLLPVMTSQVTNSAPRAHTLYTCQVCGKEFVTEKYLQMHTGLHRELRGQETGEEELGGVGGGYFGSWGGDSLGSVLRFQNKSSRCDANESVVINGLLMSRLGRDRGTQIPRSSSLSPASSSSVAVSVSRDISRSWSCDVCQKVFSQNSSYKNHMRTHSSDRPFVCLVCSIGFKERYHLKKHTLFKHSSEMREECRLCGKRFKDSTAVRAHERIHSDARPYRCTTCNKAFKTSECLWHHANRSKTCGAHDASFLGQNRRVGIDDFHSGNGTGASLNLTFTEEKHFERARLEQINLQGSAYVNLYAEEVSSVNNVSDAVRAVNPARRIIQETVPVYQIAQGTQPAVPSSVSNKSNTLAVAEALLMSFAASANAPLHPSNFRDLLSPSAATVLENNQTVNGVQMRSGTYQDWKSLVVQSSTVHPSAVLSPLSFVSLPLVLHANASVSYASPSNEILQPSHTAQSTSLFPNPKFNVEHSKLSSTSDANNSYDNSASSANATVCPSPLVISPGTHNVICVLDNPSDQISQTTVTEKPEELPFIDDSSADVRLTRFVSSDSSESEQGLAILANCAIYRPGCDAQKSYAHPLVGGGGVRVQVKVEPEAELLDYDLTAMTSPNLSPCYERMHSGETTVDGGNNLDSIYSSELVISSSSPEVEMRYEGKGVEESLNVAGEFEEAGDGSRSLECTRCEKTFSTVASFEKHVLTHSDARPYRCDVCSVTFKLKTHLKKHALYLHSDVYGCECAHCGKRFKDASALRLHERTHSADRPYKCAKCAKSFKTRENMWGHNHRGACSLVQGRSEENGDDDDDANSLSNTELGAGTDATVYLFEEQDCVEEQIVETLNVDNAIEMRNESEEALFDNSTSAFASGVKISDVPFGEKGILVNAFPDGSSLNTTKNDHLEWTKDPTRVTKDVEMIIDDNNEVNAEQALEQNLPQHINTEHSYPEANGTPSGFNFVVNPSGGTQDLSNIAPPRLENIAFITFDSFGRMILISAQNIAQMLGNVTGFSQINAPPPGNTGQVQHGTPDIVVWPPQPSAASNVTSASAAHIVQKGSNFSAPVSHLPSAIVAPNPSTADNKSQLPKSAWVGSLPTAVVNPIQREVASYAPSQPQFSPSTTASVAKRHLPPFESFVPTFRSEMTSSVGGASHHVQLPKQEAVIIGEQQQQQQQQQPMVWLNAVSAAGSTGIHES